MRPGRAQTWGPVSKERPPRANRAPNARQWDNIKARACALYSSLPLTGNYKCSTCWMAGSCSTCYACCGAAHPSGKSGRAAGCATTVPHMRMLTHMLISGIHNLAEKCSAMTSERVGMVRGKALRQGWQHASTPSDPQAHRPSLRRPASGVELPEQLCSAGRYWSGNWCLALHASMSNACKRALKWGLPDCTTGHAPMAARSSHGQGERPHQRQSRLIDYITVND